MNARWHDEFLSLCALFPSGELTEEEWALLQVHLAYCNSCLVAFREFEQLAQTVSPVIAAVATPGYSYGETPESASFSYEHAERKLMERLDHSRGLHSGSIRNKVASPIALGLIAASLVAVASLIGEHVYHRSAPLNGAATQMPAALRSVDSHSRPPQEKLSAEAAQSQILRLKHQVDRLQKTSQDSSNRIAALNGELAARSAAQSEMGKQRDTANQQLAIAETENESLRDQLSVAIASSQEQRSHSIALEAKLTELDSRVKEGERTLALDKELLAHDREIRDVIGARDLYVAEITDVRENGKTAKPFGRVFYTKERSLVFYGYDLDRQPGLAQSVTFQAWGRSDAGAHDVSLGMFYQDESHKRWILKFDDAKTLARLQMVFVTAEPQGGSQKPTGKPLLTAYLQMKPNHP